MPFGNEMQVRVDQSAQTAVDPLKNDLWLRVPMSLIATGSVVNPAALATIAQIEGFNTWKDKEIWRLDYIVWSLSGNGAVFDMGLYVGGVQWALLPLVKAANVPVGGTVFLAPVNKTISINAVAGSGSDTYNASMTMTRLLNGFRAG